MTIGFDQGQPPHSKTYRTLLNRGPQPATEINRSSVSVEMRQDGVSRFNPSTTHGGHALQQARTAVFYIDGKHEPKTVIETWAAENERVVESMTGRALVIVIGRHGQSWRSAASSLFDTNSDHSGHAAERGGKCSLCGEWYTRDLSDHLPECRGGATDGE